MLPDLDSLALFVRAAEMGNLTRAAEASFITVPAASRRLSLLEHQFKVQLFERHSRGLELTAAGAQLLVLAREVIADVHQMRSQMANYTQGSRSVLRVHGNTSAMTQFLPADIAGFQAIHPDVRIVLQECWSDDGARKVRSGEIDLAVVVDGTEVGDLAVQPYRCDHLAAVVHAEATIDAQSLAFEALLDHDLVGLEGGSTLTRLLAAQAAQLHRTMVLRVQVRSFEAVCRAVEARLGVGVLPLAAARSFASSMPLRVLPLSDAWAVRRMLLVSRQAPPAGSPLELLVGHLQQASQDLQDPQDPQDHQDPQG
jgi:DNA-binding transcriptional LysR family regulator